MKVLFINNDGGGFADHIEIDQDTTVEALFEERLPGRKPDYFIRVNHQPTSKDQVLAERRPGQHDSHQDRRGAGFLRLSLAPKGMLGPRNAPGMPFGSGDLAMTEIKRLVRVSQKIQQAWLAGAAQARCNDQYFLDRLTQGQEAMHTAWRYLEKARHSIST